MTGCESCSSPFQMTHTSYKKALADSRLGSPCFGFHLHSSVVLNAQFFKDDDRLDERRSDYGDQQ